MFINQARSRLNNPSVILSPGDDLGEISSAPSDKLPKSFSLPRDEEAPCLGKVVLKSCRVDQDFNERIAQLR